MMSWQTWSTPESWPADAPPVKWLKQPLQAGHEVTLWLFRLDAPVAPDDPGAALLGCLSPPEQDRAQRFRFAQHAQRHRVSRAMLRHLLAHLTQRRAADLTWHLGTHGKPTLLDDAPRIHFNLSHSEGWALLATSLTVELGVDIETHTSRTHLTEMAERIFSPPELERLPNAPSSSNQQDLLLRTWTRKEACLKALGCGLSQEMNTLTLGAASAHMDHPGPQPLLSWRDLTLPEDCPAWGALAWIDPAATSN